MRLRHHTVVAWSIAAAGLLVPTARAADAIRKPLGAGEREAVLALMTAIDQAQRAESVAAAPLLWDPAVLKTSTGSAYIPFRLRMADGSDVPKTAMILVRAVSRNNGVARTDQESLLRPWVEAQGFRPTPWLSESVMLAPGDMPVSGPAAASVKRSIQNASQASTALALVTRARDKEKKDLEVAHPLFPFEDYYIVGAKSPRGSDPHAIDRALTLPSGEYDVYLAMLDRSRKDAVPVIARERLTVPDFWNDRLSVSSILFVSDVHALKAAFSGEQQAEHAYAFGRAEVVPAGKTSFTRDEALSVVFQACNYGAPDSDLSAEYNFFRVVDGARRPFNHTDPQEYDDGSLPPTSPWSSQAFLTQAVPLSRFAVGAYELDVIVTDRRTRSTAKGTVAFTVVPEVR
jgi:hypothetical protein